MITDFALALGEEVNARLDAEPILNAIAFHADKVLQTGTTLKAFCPIHQDSRFRSLLVDAERKAFRCTIKTCAGYGGGSLLELYSLSRKIPPIAAACELVQRLELDLEPGWREELIQSYLAEAGAAIERGDLTDAETLLRELLTVVPDLADAQIMLANIQAEMGDPHAAAEEYIRVIDQFMASDRINDADSLAADALQRFPDNEDLLFIRVRLAEAQGDSELAVSRMQEIVEAREATNRHLDNVGLLEQLVEKSSNRPDFSIKLADLYEQQHNVRAASRQYEIAARLYLADGQMSQGIDLLEKVVQFNTENVRARLELADHLLKSGNVDKARDQTFRAVNQQIDQQEFGPAVSTVNNWLELEPDNIDARELLARIYLDQDRPDEAAKFLLEGAGTAAEQGNHSRAADLLLRAKFLTPDAAQLRRQLIAQFQATGELQRAAFEMVDLAEILFSSDETEQAVALLSEGLSNDISTKLKVQMVLSLANHGQNQTALEHLNALVEGSTDTTPPDELADLYEALSRLEPQVGSHHLRHVEALWQVSPERALETTSESASWLLKQGFKQDAVELLKLAAENISDYVPIALQLFELAEQAGQPEVAGTLYQVSIQGLAELDAEAALKLARRMVALDAAHPSAASDIAFILASLGRTEEAAEQYAHVASLLRDSGDYENGLQFAREAVALYPTSTSALAIQALLGHEVLTSEEAGLMANELLAAGRETNDRESATTAYLTYIELNPNENDVLKEAIEVFEKLAATEAAAHVRCRQASNLAVAGDWEAARTVLQKAAASAPGIAAVHEQLGEACQVTGQHDEAATAYATASSLYARVGDIDNAIRCVESARQSDPQTVNAWEALYTAAETTGLFDVTRIAAKNLTTLYTDSNNIQATARWAREWVRLSSEDPQAHFKLGTALGAIDQPEPATQELLKAAAFFSKLGQPEQAMEALDAAAEFGIIGSADQDILNLIVNDDGADANLKARAATLLGHGLVQKGELAEARKLAVELPQNKHTASLWTSLGNAEPDAKLATGDLTNAAKALREGGDVTSAIARLKTAFALGQPTDELVHMLATLLTGSGQVEEAFPYHLLVLKKASEDKSSSVNDLLSELQATYGDKVDARLEFARILLQAGKKAKATKELEAAAQLAVAENNAAALVKICGLDESLTRESAVLTRARADSLMGMENAEQALEWIVSSGRQLLEAGKAGEALEMAQRWISLAPREPDAYRLQASALTATGKSGEANKARLKIAELLSVAGSRAEALAEVDQLLQDAPSLEPAIRLKADLQKATGDTAEAAKTLRLLADSLLSHGDDAAALEVFSEGLELNPVDAAALWSKAELVSKLDGLAAARGFYRKWVDVRRDTVDQVQWIDDLKRILSIFPDSASLLRQISTALMEAGKTAEAEPYLSNLALLLETEGDFAGAAQALETLVVNSAPVPPEQLVSLADLYRKASQPTTAQNYFRQAGQALKDSGRNEEAVDAFESLLKLSGEGALPEDFALAASAYAAYGDADTAIRLIDQGLESLQQQSSNRQRRESLLEQALVIAPLNLTYVLPYLDLLPPSRAMTAGLRIAREMTSAGHPDDAIKVLTQTAALAPHDMSLRQEIFEPLRLTGDTNRLRQELLALAADALAAGDADACHQALDEAATLAVSGQHFRAIAELNERARRINRAAEYFATSAVLFANDSRSEQALACVNRAISADPLAFSAESMANLVLKLGSAIHDVAREQLRSALTARRQKQSQVLALSLLETADAERSQEILRTIFTLGGSTFVVGIARERIKALVKSGELPGALAIATSVMTIAPDSPDAWYLSAQVNRQAGNPADARRAALEAARLFHTAGAVTEEEECYNEALAAEPSNLDVKLTLADYLVREHREDEAVAQLLSIISAAEFAGNTDLLVDSLNRAVHIAPANADLREKLAMTLEPIAPDSAIENWLQVAWQLQEDKQHDRARRVFGHVLALNPQNESALQGILDHVKHRGELDAAASYTIALAEVKASRKNLGEACRLFQSYLELDPDNLDMLERLSALAGKSNDAEVFSTTTRALAKKFQKLGDNENALRHYELLIERQPGDAVVLAALLDCAAAAGNPEKGLTYARQLLSVARETEDPERIRLAAATILNYDNEDAGAHQDLAEALLSLNRVPQAATEFVRAAELFEERGNTTSAIQCYRKTTQISPSTVQAWRRLGDMAMDAGDTDTARISLIHVLDKASDGDKHRVAHLLERLLHALPDDADLHKVALDHYRKVADGKNVVRECLWLANQSEHSGDHETALQILTDALTFAPSDDELKNAHFKMVRQLGRVEELQMRLREQAEDYERSGRLEEAINVRKELTMLLPGQISQHRELAQLLEKANLLDDALNEHLQIIQLLLDKAELEQAREHAEATVEKYPSDSGCRVSIADVLVSSAYPDLAARYYSIEAKAAIARNNYDTAINLLEKALAARPAWIEVRELLADALAKAGRSDEAFQARIQVSQALIEAGELLQATETLDQLRIQRPNSPDVREQLAELHGRSGNREEQAGILAELADLYRSSGDATRALHVYRKLAALTPDNPVVLSHYVEVLAQANVPPDDLPQEYTRLADTFARNGDYEAAFQTYEQAIGLAPDSTSARSRFASFLLGRGSKQRALNEMRTLGTLYVERNEPVAAVEVLNAALTISPRDADLCLALATAQDAAGMHEDAKVSYARASAILASTAAVKGVDTYRRILTQDENNTAVRLRLVELLMNAGDKMEAAREARILAEIHINRGELSDAEHVYRLIDDCTEESLEDVQEAVRRDSYDPSLQYVHYVRLGNRHFDCGNVDGALDAYRTARSLHDDQPELIQKCIDCVSLIAPEAEAIPDYLLLAEKFLANGDYSKAKSAYDKVRLLDPFNNDAKCGLEAVHAADRKKATTVKTADDELVLKASRSTKRVALTDLLIACREASEDPTLTSDSQNLGATKT